MRRRATKIVATANSSRFSHSFPIELVVSSLQSNIETRIVRRHQRGQRRHRRENRRPMARDPLPCEASVAKLDVSSSLQHLRQGGLVEQGNNVGLGLFR